MRKLFAAACLAAIVSACSSTTATTNVAAVQSKVSTTVANVQADAVALKPILLQLCALGAVADGAFKAVGPVAGASASDVADEAKASATLNLACSTANDPTNIASDVAAAKDAVSVISGKAVAAAPSGS